jgi:hypothetical protein
VVKFASDITVENKAVDADGQLEINNHQAVAEFSSRWQSHSRKCHFFRGNGQLNLKRLVSIISTFIDATTKPTMNIMLFWENHSEFDQDNTYALLKAGVKFGCKFYNPILNVTARF